MEADVRLWSCLVVLLLALPFPAAIAKTKQQPPPPAVTVAVDTSGPAAGQFLAPAIETSSSAVAYHPGTGLHAAFAGYGNAEGGLMFYAQCVASDCTSVESWARVELPLPQAVKVQLALTPAGHPRLLGAGWSAETANGTDYVYAECDANCLDRASWRLGKVASTADGLMSNISRSRLSERTFALDERGAPRFIVADANYLVEPDHYGAFYMACERDCTRRQNWTETNLANQVGYNTESFAYPVLALAAGGKARLIANVYAFDEDGNDLEDGLYYYECDGACTTRGNWSRTRVIERGYGSYPDPSWDLKVDPAGKPRLAFFAGAEMSDAGLSHQLIYAWCDEGCTVAEGENWFGYPIGVGEGIGESPSLALSKSGDTHLAFITDGHELGYASCAGDCENAEGATWAADFGERIEAASAQRPTAIPFTCDGEVWSAMAPHLTLVGDRPHIGYDLSVEARCLYKEFGEPEITYEFHEIWRGARLMRP